MNKSSKTVFQGGLRNDAKPAMVCTANDLQEWKDFPKGLRVLLLDEDRDSSSEIRSKLEAMDYIVSIFCNETEAVSAFSSKPESFHLAIVEVNANNQDGTFKFLETAKELPTIMTSSTHCLSTIMKCIALGAVEFLRKPLSEDKLRNIWQHVVHKAFNAGGVALPVKEPVVPTIHVKLEVEEPENLSEAQENELEPSSESDKYPAPSTPQLKQGARLLDDGDCHDQTNFSAEKESGEQDGESKSVETTCDDSVAEVTLPMLQPEMPGTVLFKDEGCLDVSKNKVNVSSHGSKCESPKKTNGDADNPSKVSSLSNSSLSKSNRKKMKVDWTPELHKKFVHAVEQLGVDQAIPSRILELMKVQGLTRHNVASHLQKYRMHKRHILPKEEERRWPRPRDPVQRNCYPHQQPVMAYPTYHSNHTVPVAPAYPMWGQPGQSGHPASLQMWAPPAYPSWQPAESWQWKPYTTVPADAWGCPVMPHPPQAPYLPYTQNATVFHQAGAVDNFCNVQQNSLDLQPAEEIIDKVVKEAINKPWLPLPLGLKPPSTDSVLSELSRQGISTIPPHITQ